MKKNEMAIRESAAPVLGEMMSLSLPPAAVIADAQAAAAALKDIIAKKPRPVRINGEQYLEFEDWQTLGKFYGVTAKIVSTNFIQFDSEQELSQEGLPKHVRGFEARAVAIDSDGRERSAAEAMCLADEVNWRGKPLYMLRSMAQTRAAAKALRNVLAWVGVLAGYKPGALEEVDEAPRASKPVDYIKHLSTALLNHCNGEKRGAIECLKELTGKTSTRELTQDEARVAIEKFESQYLGAEARMI